MRVVFMGTGDIGLPALASLFARERCEVTGVVTQPDKPVGRRQELKAGPVKEMALRHGLAVFQLRRIRDPEALKKMAALRPDVIVVMAYGQILPKALLDLPRLVCLNLHASLLPRHRGAAPVQAAIMAGDAQSGITVMHVAEGLDTGDILLRRSIPIDPHETGGSLHAKLARLAPEALGEALDLVAAGTAPRIPQDDSAATYAGKLTREHGRIDWKMTCEQIERFVRALNPWPGAYTVFQDRKVKVFATSSHIAESGVPGEVLGTGEGGILVRAGAGAVLLREVQLEGKRRMAASDFVRGHGLKPGDELQ